MGLSKLKELAMAATPGPWSTYDECADNGEFSHVEIASADGTPIIGEEAGPGKDDSYFIAAANPAAILDLISLVERQEAELRAQAAVDDGKRQSHFSVEEIRKMFGVPAYAAVAPDRDMTGIHIPAGDARGSVLDQLYAAWHREPAGDTLRAIGCAIQELQAATEWPMSLRIIQAANEHLTTIDYIWQGDVDQITAFAGAIIAAARPAAHSAPSVTVDTPEFYGRLTCRIIAPDDERESEVAGLIAHIDAHTAAAVAAERDSHKARIAHLTHERDLARSSYKTLADASPASSVFCPECHMRESMPQAAQQQPAQAALSDAQIATMWLAAQDQAISAQPAPIHFARAIIAASQQPAAAPTRASDDLQQAIDAVDSCMDMTVVEPEDAAAWQIVRKHIGAAPAQQGDGELPQDERVAFEVAALERGFSANAIMRDERGTYYHMDLRMMRDGWKAALLFVQRTPPAGLTDALKQAETHLLQARNPGSDRWSEIDAALNSVYAAALAAQKGGA